MSQLFWMGDFGDNPQKCYFFQFVEPKKLIFWDKDHFWHPSVFFEGSSITTFWIGVRVLKLEI